MPRQIKLDGNTLTLNDVVDFAFAKSPAEIQVQINQDGEEQINKARQVVEKIIANERVVYGINTGFGLLSEKRISADQLEQLQINLLRSHATGVGEPLAKAEVRAALLLRANTLAKGHSGCSLELVDKIIEVMNAGITPWVPSQGSVGACGDLAPLAHLALVLIGEGRAWFKEKFLPGADVLKAAGIKPYVLGAKEGLSLINGTQIMTAIGALVTHSAQKLAKIAEISGAISLEAYKGTWVAFDPRIQAIRPHRRQIDVAENMITLLKNSQVYDSHIDCDRVQDPYSFRCIPQVHGISRETIDDVVRTIEVEINAGTDNPLVFLDDSKPEGGSVLSGGNFHGQYVAMAMDKLAIGLAELANIAENRIQKLINPAISGLPAFLIENAGLNSGMMIVQVAAASLVSENKVLCHPASIDSIPTSADKEDHVSMGTIAARKCKQVLFNVENVLAMELLCGTQGLEFHQPLKAGKGVQAAYECIRSKVKPIKQDRAFHEDIEAIRELISSGELLRQVEQATGPLK